jgi:excinuclease ABC subunit C
VVQYHRLSRTRGEMRSRLDDIPGIGPGLRAALLTRFGSVERLRAAGEEDIMQVPGIGRARAAQIRRFFDEPGI